MILQFIISPVRRKRFFGALILFSGIIAFSGENASGKSPGEPVWRNDSPPSITREECAEEMKVACLVHWFILYDPVVQPLGLKEANSLFQQGYLPPVMVGDDPARYSKKFRSLAEWFAIKILLDLQSLRKASQNAFAVFLGRINQRAAAALAKAGETAARYGLSGNPLEAKEIEKIPAGWRQEQFKKNLLEVNILTAEMRILGWIYHLWFGGWYGQSVPWLP